MQNHMKIKQLSSLMDVHVDSLMLIAVEGSKLKGTKTSDVIHGACSCTV